MARTRHSQVTHYYFEDCCYYTPLESYPMSGRILFREPDDVSTGRKRINQAAGKPVSSTFIRATRPPLRKIPADFDPARYLRFHPDVARAGVDPAEHYLTFGYAEGRAYR
jgi:hypothetical protein